MRDAANALSSSRPKATADIETITAAIAGEFRKLSNFDTFRYFRAFEALLLFEEPLHVPSTRKFSQLPIKLPESHPKMRIKKKRE